MQSIEFEENELKEIHELANEFQNKRKEPIKLYFDSEPVHTAEDLILCYRLTNYLSKNVDDQKLKLKLTLILEKSKALQELEKIMMQRKADIIPSRWDFDILGFIEKNLELADDFRNTIIGFIPTTKTQKKSEPLRIDDIKKNIGGAKWQ